MMDAETTLNQLGGSMGSLVAMIGAKHFSKDTNMVKFQYMSGAKNKANRIEIRLNSKDLYDVTFFKILKGERKIKGEFTDVYCDGLKPLFEKETALYLSF